MSIEFSLPEDRNWELVEDEGEVKRLIVNDKGNYELLPPFVWECIRCGEQPQTPDPEEPPFCLHCGKRKCFKPLFPVELKGTYGSGWHIPWFLPNKPKECDSFTLFTEIKDCIGQHLVLPEEKEYSVLALWSMATWKVDNFNTCPYLLFRGEIESGKTRALEILTRLAYHMIPTVGATPAVLRKQIQWFRCGCAIDQAEDQLNRKFEAGQQMYRLIAAGYKKGMFVARCREGNPNRIDYDDPFGFKAFASTRSFDTAIDSRSIIIDMEEATPEKKDIDEEWCSNLRSKLLYWRLCKDSVPLIVETKLSGRTRELFMSLLCVASITGIQEEVEEFAFKHQKQRRMELLSQLKASIIEIIDVRSLEIEQAGEDFKVFISEIKNKLEDRGATVSSSTIGRHLSNLGIERGRDWKRGTFIDLTSKHNMKKMEYWRKKYSLEPKKPEEGVGQQKITEENTKNPLT